jgi:DNA replication and repair protein RecF
MALSRLRITDFRCFSAADLEFSATVNLISGDNASGKTSLLEAVFFLGRGRSFRTAKTESLMRRGTEGFVLSAQVLGPAGAVSVGIARTAAGLEARLGGAPAQGLAQLAELLPVQLFDSGAHELVEGGPRHRRQFLDWGVFHVEPGFLETWRRYQRALKQRNTLLRQGATDALVRSWEPELAAAGKALHDSRLSYLARLEPVALGWVKRLLAGPELSFRYLPGWPDGKALEVALADSRQRDRETGVTQTGPHRADLRIDWDGIPAQQRVSRGQQKVLAGALLLAQAAFVHEATQRRCLLLLDDVAAELDARHLSRFLDLVQESGAQVFLTSVEPARFPAWSEASTFHVEQGEIHRVV